MQIKFCRRQGHFVIGSEAPERAVGGQTFHGHVSVILKLAKHIVVIDLSRPGLVPAGDVGNVDQTDEVDTLFQLSGKYSHQATGSFAGTSGLAATCGV